VFERTLRIAIHTQGICDVQGLTKFAVKDFETVETLMEEGNRSRTVASTNMNSESSRSHAVFSLIITQEQYDPISEHTGQKVGSGP